MAQNGWERLGAALAGTSPARQAEIRQKTIDALARTDYNLAKSREAVQGQVQRESLGETFAQIMPDVAASGAYANAHLAGVNLNELTNATGNIQEQGFRGNAVNAATGGDWGGANAQMLGVANGPVAIPAVQGNMLLSNRLVPGGGTVTTTPVGESMISENLAQGQAALIRANRPSASGGGGGSQKLGELDKIRLNAALKDLEPMIAAARNEVISNQGASSPAAQRRMAEAQARLTQLQGQRDQIITTFGGGPAAPPVPTEWTSTTTGETRALAPGYTVELMEQLSAINRDRTSRGEPALTAAEAAQFRTTGGVKPAAAARGPQQVTSKAQFDRLPSGTQFIAPDGSVRVKP